MLATFRIKKDKENPYVMLHKHFLTDKNLSWRDKGILAYLLSKPDNWIVRVEDIRNHAREADKAIRTSINNLLQHRYLNRNVIREEGKFSRFEYDVYEHPNLNKEPFSHFGKMVDLVINDIPDKIAQYHNTQNQVHDQALRSDVEAAGLTWTESSITKH